MTLASLTESSGSWTQQSYDLTHYAGTKIRVAMHITTAVQNYAFWDSFALSAGQLNTAGAPLAPQGVSAEAELVYDAQADSWGVLVMMVLLYSGIEMVKQISLHIMYMVV